MRKILLATTALVGFAVAGAAQAATSPLTVTVGGDVDVMAGAFHEGKVATQGVSENNDDFNTLYDLNFAVNGKTGNGIEYGGNLSLDNNPDISNLFMGESNQISVTEANVFLSGAFGKLVLGDSHGATDLAIAAPTVGEGQVTGSYIDFLDTFTFAKNLVVGIDGTDHSTNITYFTPKVGNDTQKVQAGVTFAPNFYNYGSSSVEVANNQTQLTAVSDVLSPYRNVVKGAIDYTGSFKPVTVGVSADVITGSTKDITQATATGTSASGYLPIVYNPLWLAYAPAGEVQDFTAWGVGAQVAAEGFTFGATYNDLGSYDTVVGQGRDQRTVTAGLKYEFGKAAVAASYEFGEGYDNDLAFASSSIKDNSNYVAALNSYSLGGAYTWAPGLTTNVDGVLFDQRLATSGTTPASVRNDGYVLLVSQKLAF
jgi:hypothetical protein